MSDTETTDTETDSTDTTTDGDEGWISTPDDGADDRERQVHEHTLTLEMGRLGIYRDMNHRGGDETLVLLAACPEGYGVFAVDFASDGEPLAFEPIGSAEEEARAASMAEYWTHQNEKGILGGDDAGGGLLDMLGMGGE